MRAISRCGWRRSRASSPRSPREATNTPKLAARRAGLRVELDLRNEKINYKVREHSLAKIPALLVVGKKEAETHSVSVRRLGSEGQTVMPTNEARAALVDEATPPDVKRARQVV